MRILRPRLFRLAAALLSLVPFAASAQVNHTTSVTLANVLVNGASVPYGRLCAVAGDSYGNPVSFSSVGWGVISAGNPFCANVVNGAVSGGLSVPDANQTNRPTPITYTFSLQLTNSSFVGQSAAITLFSSVAGVSGSTFSLDSYTPPASAVVPAASNLIGTSSSVPSSCTSPSIWIVPGTTPTIYVCNNGVYSVGSTSAPSITYGTTAGTVTQGNDARIVAAFKNQGAFSTTASYNANDVVSVGSSLYYAPTAIAASTTAPPAGAWLALGGGTVNGGTVSINGVSCSVGSTCSLTPATLGLAVAATSSSPMSGLDYWIPFSQGTAVDVTGNGHNGTISGTGTAAAYVLGGIQPNAQTVSIPNASGRPSFGFCAYFPGGQAPLNYGYFYSASDGQENGYNLSTVYGAAVNHGANAYWPQIGLSAGSAASESLNGFSGNHCVEGIPGATGQNIVVDGKEVSYAAQATGASPAVGAAQLTAPMIVAGGNGVQTGLPITVYSVWGTPAASTDTVAQASARTAFEVSRLQALGIPFGAGAGLNTAATDSTCSFDGTSIDQGFEAGGVPVSTLLTLSFPCTLHDFSVTGQPASDMDAAFQDRAGSVYHPRAQKNIAFTGGFTNSLAGYGETPAQSLQDLLSWNRKAHALGYKTIVSLALSRGGTVSGTSVDSLVQAANQLVLANADEFDWVANPAAWPQLGATGAYANTTYFNPDSGTPTHPTAAGQAFYVQTEQAAFNGVYAAAPRTITASATQLPADRTVIANCTAACTYSLMDANTGNFNSRGKVTVQNVGSATVTLAAVSGETVGVANTLAVTPGTTVTIAPYEANFTTAGAVWAIQSGLGGSVSPAAVGTVGQFPASQGPGIGYTPVSISGDCTASTTTLGQLTCTKTNGTAFGSAATTNASAYDAAGAASAAAAGKAAKWSIISSKTLNPTSSTSALGTSFTSNQVTFMWQETVPAGLTPTAIRVCYGNWFPGNFGTLNGENPNFNPLQLFGSVIPNTTLNTSNTISGTTNREKMHWNGKASFVLDPGAVQCSDPIYGNFPAGSNYYPMTGLSMNFAPAPSAPTLTAASGGSFAAGTYALAICYTQTDGGCSTPSGSTITLTAGQEITFPAPASVANAMGFQIFVGSTTLQCDTGYGVLPFSIGTVAITNTNSSPNCINYSTTNNVPLGPYVAGGIGAGASNTGEGYKGGQNSGYGFYVGANCCAASYGPLYILGNVPAVSIAAVGDSIHGDGFHDDAFGGAGGGYVSRAALNQTSNRYFQTGITPNWGFVGLGRYSETAATFNSFFGTKRFNVAAQASTVNVGYGINDLAYASPVVLTNLIQIHQNFLAAGVNSTIQPTLLPHLSDTSDGWQTLANQVFNFPASESERRQLNNVFRGTVCNGTAITAEIPFANKASGNYAYNTNWYAGGDGATTSFTTACPINESGTTTVLVNGTSAAYTYANTGTINNSSATYAGSVTLTTAPASGATVTISYLPSASMATLVGSSSFHVFDGAALIEYGPGGSLTANGGLWGPAGSAVLTGLSVTSTNSTNLINTAGWSGITSTDQYRGYAVAITADSTATGAVGQTAEITSMTTTDITINGWSPLNNGSVVVPDANAVFSVLDHTDTVEGVHPSGRPHMVMGAGLVNSGFVK